MSMEPVEREIIYYTDQKGKTPFKEFFLSLKDGKTRERIYNRVLRASKGNFGDHRNFPGGIVELREHFGPGYRIYCGLDGTRFVVVLCGGSKTPQQKDIEISTVLWIEYLKYREPGV